VVRATAALEKRTGAAKADRTAGRTAAKEENGGDNAAAGTGTAAAMEVLLHIEQNTCFNIR
jgi:hypothetical protein